ncbi:MAG: hypothetical protein GXY05_08395 [Clostridiales bacterium]|nr:hypothetical protein [Clostridiales bacterium]
MLRTRNHIARLARDDRGSGLVTVLVTMLFVAILGTILLFTSYTGFLIKVSERGGKESFYSASSALDEIKVGVQQAVNESLSKAYTQVLSEYMTTPASDLQKKFADFYFGAFTGWKVGGEALIAGSDPNYTYNTAAFTSLVNLPAGGALTVNEGAASGAVEVIKDVDNVRQEIVLRGIRVDYVSPTGYASSVSTDISVTMPDFEATTSTVMSSSLPIHAIVANEGLTVASGDRTLSGSAYTGALTLRNNGSSLSFQSGTLVCPGTVSASGQVKLSALVGTEFWAGNIELGDDAIAKLYGRTYLRDDLTLAGNRAAAELRGSYFGFGAGDTADESSAIVINGKDTVFDMDSLDRLILGGVSFLDGSIRTGESVSVKSNQLAYLIDGASVSLSYLKQGDSTTTTITGQNPCVFNLDQDEDAITWSVDLTKPLWDGKTLADYGVSYNAGTGEYVGIKPVFSNITGTGGYKLAYFFLSFSDQAKANQYFKDFFTARPDRIGEYIGVYTALSDKASSLWAAGNTLYTSAAGALSIAEAVPYADVTGPALQFANRCQTLHPNKSATGLTPYSYYVNAAAILANAADTMKFYLPGDTNADAITVKGNYNYPLDDPADEASLKVIIATGNVTVNSEFNGLILAGGTVYQNSDISSAPEGVQDILSNAVSGTVPLRDYLFNAVFFGGGDGTTTTSWDLDILVSYTNWAKH